MLSNKNVEQVYSCDDKKIVLPGGGYECPFCGSRNVTKTDMTCRTCFLSFNVDIVQERKAHNVFSEETTDNLSEVTLVYASAER